MNLWNETKSIPVSHQMIWLAYKKVKANKLRFVLLRSLGDAFVTADFEEAKFEAVLAGADI